MAITGTFVADFSSFNTAVEAADVKLKSFEADSNKVEASLSRMTNALSGTKMIQDATLMAEAVERIGGVTKLTEAELQRLGTQAQEAIAKMQAMGVDVPPKLQAIATASQEAKAGTVSWTTAIGGLTTALETLGLSLTIGGVIAMGKAVMADADALVTLSDKTGITTTNLQLMQAAGDDAGVSLEAMTSAATMLQKRLGAGDEGASAALRDLGIEVAHFKSLDAAQQLDAVSQAIQGIHDPLRVADDLSKLFGKSWADLLPVLKRGFTEVHDGSTTMSAGTVKALDDAGDALGRFYRAAKANLGEAMADILTLSTSQWRRLKSELEDLPKVADPIANMWGQILPPSVPKDLDQIIEESDAWAKANKIVADGMAELEGLGRNWQATLQGIDGAIVEAVKWYLEAGASQSALAKVFGLTAAQVAAVDQSMKAYKDTIKAVMEVEKQRVAEGTQGILGLSKTEQEASQKAFEAQARAADQITKASAQLRDAQMRDALDASSYQIAKIYETADANVAAMQKSGATSAQIAEYTKQVYALADLQASQVEYTADRVLDNVTAKAIAAAKSIQDVVNVAIAQVDALQAVDLTGNAAAVAAKVGGGGSVVGPGGVTYATGAGNNDYKPLSQLPQVSFRAAGGPVQSGNPYIVGEKGPELYVPTDSGTIIPNNVITNFSNTFNLTDTADALARKVADVLMRSVMQGRKVTTS